MNFFRTVYDHFFETACFARAGSLAFTTFLALVPLMVLSVNVLALLPISQAWQTHLQDFIFSNFVVSSGHAVLNYLQIFVDRVRELSLLSIVFLMVTAVSMLFSIETSLNAIWCCCRSRFWVKAIVYYMLILLVTPLLITLSLGMTFLVKDFINAFWHIPISVRFLFKSAPITLSFIGYLFVYKIMPNCKIPWKSALISAFFSSVLFECAKVIFTEYLKLFPTYQIIYGAIAALPIFLIWVYICWLIFLLGGVVGYRFKETLTDYA